MRSPASALTRNKNMKIQNLISFLPSHRDRPPVRRCRRSICDGFSDGPEVQPDRFADTKTFSLRIFKKRSAHVLKGAQFNKSLPLFLPLTSRNKNGIWRGSCQPPGKTYTLGRQSKIHLDRRLHVFSKIARLIFRANFIFVGLVRQKMHCSTLCEQPYLVSLPAQFLFMLLVLLSYYALIYQSVLRFT